MKRLSVPVLAAGLIGLLVFATSSSAGGASCRGFAVTIEGTEGDDVIPGTNGPDAIAGLGGDDVIVGFGASDLICAGPGNDYVVGSDGPDVLSGDAGYDNVSYEGAPGPVGVSLTGGTASGAEGQDDIYGFEAVIGSDFDDVLVGGPGFNTLRGGEGDDDLNARAGIDVLVGGVGSDAIVGGEGSVDLAYYFGNPEGVVADLEDGTAVSGGDEDDLVSIEGLIGSEYPDTLLGDAGENVMGGAEGDDVVDGRGSADFLISFGRIPEDPEAPDALEVAFGGPHTIDLAAETAFDAADPTEVAGDSVVDFESAVGGLRGDVLRGTEGDDILAGEEGEDLLFGLGGQDGLDGGGGDDLLDGGDGSKDQGVYFLTSGVKANLATGVATADGDTDELVAIEQIAGSPSADVLVGDAGPNLLVGFGGKDRITGGGGKDILYGKPIELPLGDLEGAPGEETPPGDGKQAKLLDGGSGRDTCEGGKVVRCEVKRLTQAAKRELSSIIEAIQDIKRKNGARIHG